MAMNAKAAKAISAMKAIGLAEKSVKPVLKNLLKVYDKNWELIEDENYRVLADAIFESQDNEAEEEAKAKNNKEDQLQDESAEPAERPLKRLRLRCQGDQGSLSGETSLRRAKVSDNGVSEASEDEEQLEPFQRNRRGRTIESELCSPQVHMRDIQKEKDRASSQSGSQQETTEASELLIRDKRPEHDPVSPVNRSRDKGKEPALSSQSSPRQQSHIHSNNIVAESDTILPQTPLRVKGKEPVSPYLVHKEKAGPVKSNSVVCFKEPKVEPGILLLPKQKLHDPPKNDALLKPKNEPITDDMPQFEVPIAIMPPPDPGYCGNGGPLNEEGCSTGNDSTGPVGLQHSHPQNETNDISQKTCNTGASLDLANTTETSPANVEIASSPLGEVRLSLSCNASEGQDFHMPSLETVLKAVEDKCLRTYKILEPNFSMRKLMEEMCQCFLDLSKNSTNGEEESLIRLTHNLDFLKKSNLPRDSLSARGEENGNFPMAESSLMVPGIPRALSVSGLDDLHCTVPPNRSLVVVPHQNSSIDTVRQIHDVNDISKGEENVRIPLINEVSSESFPPRFYYIPRNIVYQNAYVNFSLARIVDEDCCSDCVGDCLSQSIPCACTHGTGGEFAYTLEGLVKEKFLDKCISMNRDPPQNRLCYCQDCPLERNKNNHSPGKCKGHLERKFIKECWSKCGCNKQCGNRVVQRGIACNLQVFFTSEGKGWGLRTLEDMPRGTFVCEYVGEILTNTELDERNIRSTGDEKHTYPVLLDADWVSEGVLKDEEALCLDATFYGNVARFINHRCFDANLVEIPVEVETPDHHYYHLAFFTTRDVEALEELTWDYGIDFNDHSHPVKAFRCRCGSKCCRDMKRSRRTKSKALQLR